MENMYGFRLQALEDQTIPPHELKFFLVDQDENDIKIEIGNCNDLYGDHISKLIQQNPGLKGLFEDTKKDGVIQSPWLCPNITQVNLNVTQPEFKIEKVQPCYLYEEAGIELDELEEYDLRCEDYDDTEIIWDLVVIEKQFVDSELDPYKHF